MSAPDSPSDLARRPDPFQVQRRPMARAGRDYAFANARSDGGEGALFAPGGALDVDALHRLLERAGSVIEGRPYAGSDARFYGSAVLTVPVARRDAEPLAAALGSDPRAMRVLRDRIYRELARLLGPDTPAEFDASTRVERGEEGVRVFADIEAALPGARGPS